MRKGCTNKISFYLQKIMTEMLRYKVCSAEASKNINLSSLNSNRCNLYESPVQAFFLDFIFSTIDYFQIISFIFHDFQ